MKIAGKLRLLRPMMEGRKYNERQSQSTIRWNIDAEILSQRVTKIRVSMSQATLLPRLVREAGETGL